MAETSLKTVTCWLDTCTRTDEMNRSIDSLIIRCACEPIQNYTNHLFRDRLLKEWVLFVLSECL